MLLTRCQMMFLQLFIFIHIKHGVCCHVCLLLPAGSNKLFKYFLSLNIWCFFSVVLRFCFIYEIITFFQSHDPQTGQTQRHQTHVWICVSSLSDARQLQKSSQEKSFSSSSGSQWCVQEHLWNTANWVLLLSVGRSSVWVPLWFALLASSGHEVNSSCWCQLYLTAATSLQFCIWTFESPQVQIWNTAGNDSFCVCGRSLWVAVMGVPHLFPYDSLPHLTLSWTKKKWRLVFGSCYIRHCDTNTWWLNRFPDKLIFILLWDIFTHTAKGVDLARTEGTCPHQ